MTTIRARITWSLATATLLCFAIGGAALSVWIRRALVEEFDAALGARADALQSLVTQRPDGRLEVERFPAARADAAEAFWIQDFAGRVLVASTDAGTPDPRASADGRPWTTRLSDGAPARVLRRTVRPAVEEDDDDEDERGARVAVPPTGSSVRLTVARDRRGLDATLRQLTLAIAAAVTITSAACVSAAWAIVRRGLAPLRTLASNVAAIDPTLPAAAAIPYERQDELAPIVRRLNELLGRVDEAIHRERLFAAAASHELRTPVAELRLVNELACNDETLRARAVTQSHEIALQMQSMIAALLSIASAGRLAEVAPQTSLDLANAVREAVGRAAATLNRRAIGIEEALPRTLRVLADPTMLAALLDNLFGNAARYGRAGRPVEITAAAARPGHVEIELANEPADAEPPAVARAFDPFWRGDRARSDGTHVGLGLTLVRAYCRAMGGDARARLDAAGRFVVTVSLPTAKGDRGEAN